MGVARFITALQIVVAVGCGSQNVEGDADEVATDVAGDALDDQADSAADPVGDELHEEPGRCLFHPQPIDLWVEGFDCEGLAEGEHRVRNVPGILQGFTIDTERSFFTVGLSGYDPVQVNFSGINGSYILHNLQPGDLVDITAIVYQQDKCIRGMIIGKSCAFSGNTLILFRHGDAENPLHPEYEGRSIFDVHIEESRCELSGDPVSGCDVDRVYRLTFEFHTGDLLTLEQAETGIACEGEYTSYRVENRHSYHSPDCGGDVVSYFVQMWDPPWHCEI